MDMMLINPAVMMVVATLLGAFAVAYLFQRRRADELGYIPYVREEVRDWWLWESHRLYAVVQLTVRGLPVGEPIERLVLSVSKVDEEAVQFVMRAAIALAAKQPAFLLAPGGGGQGLLPEGAAGKGRAWVAAGGDEKPVEVPRRRK